MTPCTVSYVQAMVFELNVYIILCHSNVYELSFAVIFFYLFLKNLLTLKILNKIYENKAITKLYFKEFVNFLKYKLNTVINKINSHTHARA